MQEENKVEVKTSPNSEELDRPEKYVPDYEADYKSLSLRYREILNKNRELEKEIAKLRNALIAQWLGVENE